MPGSLKTGFAYKLLILIVALSGLLLLYRFYPRHATVETVINGDTLLLENGTLVKLIGVNTPEANDPEEKVRQFGLAAADFTQNLVEGKEIRIKYYFQPEHDDEKAPASVYLADGTCLNYELIKQGYGRADAESRFGDVKEFLEYERDARENKLGLWAEPPGE